LNLAESIWVEHAAAAELRRRGLEPALVVAGPPPLAFWRRTIEWRSGEWFGSGSFTPATGVMLDKSFRRTGMNDPQLAQALRNRRYVRSFLVWSRMPIVIRIAGHSYLTDQRFYGAVTRVRTPRAFLIPLDNGPANS
jgi:inner membrane protein